MCSRPLKTVSTNANDASAHRGAAQSRGRLETRKIMPGIPGSFHKNRDVFRRRPRERARKPSGWASSCRSQDRQGSATLRPALERCDEGFQKPWRGNGRKAPEMIAVRVSLQSLPCQRPATVRAIIDRTRRCSSACPVTDVVQHAARFYLGASLTHVQNRNLFNKFGWGPHHIRSYVQAECGVSGGAHDPDEYRQLEGPFPSAPPPATWCPAVGAVENPPRAREPESARIQERDAYKEQTAFLFRPTSTPPPPGRRAIRPGQAQGGCENGRIAAP